MRPALAFLRMAVAVPCLAMVLLPVFSSTASAQLSGSSIVGVVMDESGGALPGVTVSARGPALQVPEVATVTDDRGEYRLTTLPLGTYAVRYDLAGFQSVVREEIRLTAGFVAKIDVTLKLGTFEESLTVRGNSPVVDVTSASPRTQFAREALEELPTTRNSLVTLAMQTPGTRVSARAFDVGGSQFTSGPSFNVFGREGDDWTMLEGVVISVGYPGTYQDFTSYEEAQTQVIGNTAEMPGTGVWVNAIVKSGGNAFHGGGYYGLTGPWAQSENIDADLAARGVTGTNKLVKRYDYNGDLGGRLILNKLWFYAGARRALDDPQIIGSDLRPDGEPGDAPRAQGFWTGKASYQMTPSHKLIGLFQGNWKYNIRGVGQFNTWESRVQQDQYGVTEKVEWQGIFGNSITASARFGYWDYFAPINGFAPGKVSTFDVTTLKYTGDALSSWPAPIIGWDYRYTSQATLSWFKPDLFFGNHDIKAGVDVDPSTRNWSYLPRVSGDYHLRYRSEAPFQIAIYNTPVSGVTRTDYAGTFVQDTWRKDRLTMNLGIRFDLNKGYVPEQVRPAGTFAAAETFPAVQFATWSEWGPRLHAAYDVTGRGKTAVKGGWGRYNKVRFAADVEPANPYAITTSLYTWRDVNGDRFWDPSQVNEVNLNPNGPDFVSASGGATRLPNPDEKSPHVDEFSASFEHELIPSLAVRVSGLYTLETNRRWLVGVNRGYEAYTVPVSNPDPGPDGVAGNADDTGQRFTYYEYPTAFRGAAFEKTTPVTDADQTNRYKAFEVAATKRFSANWQMMTSVGSIWKNKPFRGDLTPYNPNSEVFAYDRTRDWYFKLAGSYRLPFGLLGSANFNAVSGDPYQRTVLFRGGVTIPTQVLPVEPYGARRLPNAYLLDVRAQKTMTLKYGQRIGVRVDVFNALNSNVVTGVTDRAGASFERPTTIMPARIAQFGFTYEF
jgi:hypothetical protein